MFFRWEIWILGLLLDVIIVDNKAVEDLKISATHKLIVKSHQHSRINYFFGQLQFVTMYCRPFTQNLIWINYTKKTDIVYIRKLRNWPYNLNRHSLITTIQLTAEKLIAVFWCYCVVLQKAQCIHWNLKCILLYEITFFNVSLHGCVTN